MSDCVINGDYDYDRKWHKIYKLGQCPSTIEKLGSKKDVYLAGE